MLIGEADAKKFRVGADRRVRPHSLTSWSSITLARWMPHARAEVAGIHLQHYSMLATLSSPGPPAQHSTALRAVTFVGSGILGGWHNTSA